MYFSIKSGRHWHRWYPVPRMWLYLWSWRWLYRKIYCLLGFNFTMSRQKGLLRRSSPFCNLSANYSDLENLTGSGFWRSTSLKISIWCAQRCSAWHRPHGRARSASHSGGQRSSGGIPVYFGMICIFLPDSIDFSPKNRYTIPRVLCVVPNAQRA